MSFFTHFANKCDLKIVTINGYTIDFNKPNPFALAMARRPTKCAIAAMTFFLRYMTGKSSVVFVAATKNGHGQKACNSHIEEKVAKNHPEDFAQPV